jgi:hypothetical protein
MQPLRAGNPFDCNVFHDRFIPGVTYVSSLVRCTMHLVPFSRQMGGPFIPAQTETAIESEEVEAVLTSEAFSEAPTMSRLLKFLRDNHFSENKSSLNEYRIGGLRSGKELLCARGDAPAAHEAAQVLRQ